MIDHPDASALTSPVLSSADRNLLFGILALQMDFISRDALIAGMHAWVIEKAKPLGQILAEQGALRPEDRDMLEMVVRRHLQIHGGDAERSLASLSSVTSVRGCLQEIADSHLHASLAHLPAADGVEADPYATRMDVVGQPSAFGMRFRILREHAKGGLGTVFVADDQELHRQVALKEIQARYADHPESRSRFLLEAEVTGRLEHPGVVPVYGLGHYPDGRPFYAMRFIKGDSLHEAIREFHTLDGQPRDPGERSLAFRQLLRRFIDACNVLAYAHGRGVLHRDVKPHNIMLGKYGETLLVDWGLAKVMGDGEGASKSEEGVFHLSLSGDSMPTQAGHVMGTPAYMSPEQAEGRLDRLGPTSDIYSLGATLYELLTGQQSVGGVHLGEILAKVKRGDWLPPRKVGKDVPPPLEAICRKAMALRPEDRYASALGLAQDIEHWLADEPVSAYREPLAWKLRRWVRRHRGVAAGTAGLLVTTVALLAVGIVLINQEKNRTQHALAAEARRRQQTREALDMLSSEVIEPMLFRGPKLSSEHNRFLEKALASYEELARDSGEDETSRAGIARSYWRVGTIRRQLGQKAETEAAYRRSRELYQQLVNDFPHVPDYRQKLAATQNSVGDLLADMRRIDEAEQAFRDALALREQLVAEFPEERAYQLELAGSYNNLANLLRYLGQYQQAERLLEAAIKLYEQMLTELPGNPTYRQELARSKTNLGMLWTRMGLAQKAEAAYRGAIDLNKQLVTKFPVVAAYRQELARSESNLAAVLVGTGRPKEAEEAYRRALFLRKQVAGEFPVPGCLQDLAQSYYNLGKLLLSMSPPESPPDQGKEACRLASELLERLAVAVPDNSVYAYDAACTLAQCAKIAENDGKLAEPKRAELVRSYTDRALAMLRQAIAKGYRDVANLKKDNDLDPLRAHPEFQKVLRELEGGSGR
ncbi:MAG TPA: serine/threonine-protein kinase [Gemmataceae bacterium]|nr:serine/threonine-protein kinase [Gemmataceae bacterium]